MSAPVLLNLSPMLGKRDQMQCFLSLFFATSLNKFNNSERTGSVGRALDWGSKGC